MLSTAWQNFLATQRQLQTIPSPLCSLQNPPPALCVLEHLALLRLSGADAGRFLQGQVSADIDQLSAQLSSFGSLCDAKGKVITTFIVSKQGNDLLLVLPKVLVNLVKSTMQRYILRAKVIIQEDDAVLLGSYPIENPAPLFTSTQSDATLTIHLQTRDLIICRLETAIAFCEQQLAQGAAFQESMYWQYCDINQGIAWLTLETSQQFIAQMLNVDKLGGISFTKGCYTGQEIIARTHYLGKVKRQLALAKVALSHAINPLASITNKAGQHSATVLNAVVIDNSVYLLIVLTDTSTHTGYFLETTPVQLLRTEFNAAT